MDNDQRSKDVENPSFNPPPASGGSPKTRSNINNYIKNIDGGCEIFEHPLIGSTIVETSPTTPGAPDMISQPDSGFGMKVLIKLKGIVSSLLRITGFLLLLILQLLLQPLFLLYGAWVDPSCIGADSNYEKKDDDVNGKKGVYARTGKHETVKEHMLNVYALLLIKIGTVFLAWLPVTIYVRSLKESTVLGSPHWKWTLFALTLIWVHVLAMFYTLAIFDLRFTPGLDKLYKTKHRVEYYVDGLGLSFSSVFSFGFILVVWLVYFRTGYGLKKDSSAGNEEVLSYGTWTLVSLFFGTILWLVKRSLLLSWMANAIYRRFKPNIQVAGFQLYFLALITDGRNCTFLMPRWAGKDRSVDGLQVLRDCILGKNETTLFQLKVVARWITDLAEVTSREDDTTAQILENKWRDKIHDQQRMDYMMTKQDLMTKFELNQDDAELLYAELKIQNQCDEKEITYAKLIKWMVDSHNNCLTLGYTLVDSEAVSNSLNLVLRIMIVIVVILLWLLITQLANIKFLVLIAPPILGLSFVFGDTAKNFFQGIIFCFITHPFNVRDWCIIDGIEMRVKQMGILTTTFKKVGSGEHLLYFNSELATKSITNLQSQPNPDDELELELDYTGKIRTTNLLTKIEELLNNNVDLFESRHLVTVRVIGDKIKIVIQFTHKMGSSDGTHSRYFQKKIKQRSYLLAIILDMIEDQRHLCALEPAGSASPNT